MGKFLANATSANVARSSDLIKNLNLASRQLYTQLAHELDHDFGLDQKGLIMLCRTKEGFHEEQQLGQTARTLGLSIADCSKEVLRQMEPGAEISAVGAVHFKDDAHLNPRAFMAAITERLEQLNVCFVKEDAVSFTAGTNRISSMRTSSKTVEADEFVIAVGAWTQQLAGQIGQNLPMVSGRGYGFTLPPEKLKLLHPAILVESRIAVTPTSEGIRFVGCLELGAPSTRPYAKRLEAMKDAIPCYYPGVNRSDLDTLEIWTGHRPCTPDGLPYIGRSKKIENLVWASGHAMMGLSLGPITGSLVSQIVEGHSPDFPMSLLSPERYAS
jgi:D-amino-acid dehydrogenase